MTKIILFSLLIFSISFSKDIPIQKVIKITLPIGKPSILKFPFKIRGIKATSFIYEVKVKNNLDGLENLSLYKNNNSQINYTKKIAISKKRPILISRGIDTVTITPKKEGRMSLIIWGYKYPLLLDIKTEFSNNMDDRYINFLDYSTSQKQAVKFEAAPHEKVIVKLIKYLYHEKIPQGYTYEVGKLDYVTNGIRLIQVKVLKGNEYKVEEWIIQNRTKNKIILYPQMFYSKGIYAIAFENNKLKPNEKVRMFIVAKK